VRVNMNSPFFIPLSKKDPGVGVRENSEFIFTRRRYR
jgi:hypothetical protein